MGKAWHDVAVTPAIEDDSPAGAAERAAAAQSSFVVANHFVLPEERDFLGVVLGARYGASPLVVPDGKPPPDEIERYTPSSIPGGRAPHLWLDDKRGRGSSLFDRFGRYFTLLRSARSPRTRRGSRPPRTAPACRWRCSMSRSRRRPGFTNGV